MTDQRKINEIKIADLNWNKSHWNTLINNYKDAPYFEQFRSQIYELYQRINGEEYLSEINSNIIKYICEIIGIQTRITNSSDYSLSDDRNFRLVELCTNVNAKKYISGPAAKCYLDEKLFNDHGIDVLWMDYSGYLEYSQVHPPFEHGVSILDLLFNEGPNATEFMKSFHKS